MRSPDLIFIYSLFSAVLSTVDSFILSVWMPIFRTPGKHKQYSVPEPFPVRISIRIVFDHLDDLVSVLYHRASQAMFFQPYIPGLRIDHIFLLDDMERIDDFPESVAQGVSETLQFLHTCTV